jgi:nucleotide-binding universal stress UspA family protein
MDPRNVKRILVPTDFADPSSDALGTAMAFAQISGATLDLVHVTLGSTFVLPPPLDLATLDTTKVSEHVARELAVEEERVRAVGLACETASLVGAPDEEIVTRARETGAALIIMGTHGRSGLAHALFGSVTERVLRHTSCPLLVVPTAVHAQ